MASGHGRYAAEAAAGPLHPDTNLTQVQQAQVREYREKYLLFNDADFAYAFSSLEEAKLAGGDFLAAACAQVRAQEDEKLIPAAAAAVENPSSSAFFRGPSTKADMPLSKRPAIRLRPNDSQPEQILQRVDTLKQVFLEGRVLPPEELDLISFVNQGTEAPVRALNGLRWLVKNGNLGWPLSGVRTPVPTDQKTKKKSQAVVVEPPMMSFLEDQIEEHFRLGNSNWRRLLGTWLVAQGCLRYRHVSLSTPVKLTLSTLHARCAKGKQVANRQGFEWAAPARFTSGFAWAEAWLQEYQQLPVAVATKAMGFPN
eukprot:s2906_g11.t1